MKYYGFVTYCDECFAVRIEMTSDCKMKVVCDSALRVLLVSNENIVGIRCSDVAS